MCEGYWNFKICLLVDIWMVIELFLGDNNGKEIIWIDFGRTMEFVFKKHEIIWREWYLEEKKPLKIDDLIFKLIDKDCADKIE